MCDYCKGLTRITNEYKNGDLRIEKIEGFYFMSGCAGSHEGVTNISYNISYCPQCGHNLDVLNK